MVGVVGVSIVGRGLRDVGLGDQAQISHMLRRDRFTASFRVVINKRYTQ